MTASKLHELHRFERSMSIGVHLVLQLLNNEWDGIADDVQRLNGMSQLLSVGV